MLRLRVAIRFANGHTPLCMTVCVGSGGATSGYRPAPAADDSVTLPAIFMLSIRARTDSMFAPVSVQAST
jgi:hypothetical protein